MLDHVMMIDKMEKYCGDNLVSVDCALFNGNKITEQEARRLIESEEYSPYLIIVTQEQFEGLFQDGDVNSAKTD